MANKQLAVSTQGFSDFRERMTPPELLILLAATKYALADAQIFDWLVEKHGLQEEKLADLRQRVNNTFTPSAQTQLTMA